MVDIAIPFSRQTYNLVDAGNTSSIMVCNGTSIIRSEDPTATSG
jgi:hypothetical protein